MKTFLWLGGIGGKGGGYSFGQDMSTDREASNRSEKKNRMVKQESDQD